MKKIILAVSLLFTFSGAFSQELTAKLLSENSIKKASPQKAQEYAVSQIKSITEPSEKRSAYIFLGSLYELTSDFEQAGDAYVTAAGIAAGDAPGMPKKSTEQLVIDATRCALSAGETEVALSYLNSSVRNSKNEEIQAYIKLYEQWAALTVCESSEFLEEPVTFLKTYAKLESMKAVRPAVLLTLWYITGDSAYSDQLNKDFPASAETGIVNGKIQILPTPFWYFVPKNQVQKPVEEEKPVKVEKTVTVETPQESTYEKPVRQQLGLFRDKANAQSYVERVNSKGFNSYIQEETRESGTTYFIVVVDEDKQGSISTQLKTCGFECYPIY